MLLFDILPWVMNTFVIAISFCAFGIGLLFTAIGILAFLMIAALIKEKLI